MERNRIVRSFEDRDVHRRVGRAARISTSDLPKNIRAVDVETGW